MRFKAGWPPARCAELVEVAMVAADGRTFQTLVRPRAASSRRASQVHGIDPGRLAAAPPFTEIAATVRQWLAQPRHPAIEVDVIAEHDTSRVGLAVEEPRHRAMGDAQSVVALAKALVADVDGG